MSRPFGMLSPFLLAFFSSTKLASLDSAWDPSLSHLLMFEQVVLYRASPGLVVVSSEKIPSPLPSEVVCSYEDE